MTINKLIELKFYCLWLLFRQLSVGWCRQREEKLLKSNKFLFDLLMFSSFFCFYIGSIDETIFLSQRLICSARKALEIISSPWILNDVFNEMFIVIALQLLCDENCLESCDIECASLDILSLKRIRGRKNVGSISIAISFWHVTSHRDQAPCHKTLDIDKLRAALTLLHQPPSKTSRWNIVTTL